MNYLPKQTSSIIKGSMIAFVATLSICNAEVESNSEIQPLDISKDLRDQVSEGMGYIEGQSIAAKLLNAGFILEDFSAEGFAKGIESALGKETSEVKIQEYKVAIDLLKAKLQERELQLGKTNLIKSAKWIETNADKENVLSTTNGLQYEIITQGEGEIFKALDEGVEDKRKFLIAFNSKTIDGDLIEASPDKKIMSVRENLMPGLDEALKLMPVGSEWKLYLKPELAYGSRRAGAKMEPNSVAVVTVKLLGITNNDGSIKKGK